ncbi:hypothetical protein AB3G33_10485 [Flavobacterium sp. WC2421]|uniref:hypothetical protein n=1 Tax=Flavobacterium sp. WC2421 TaxID=3234138 RepID=UPI00346755A3
MLKFLKNTGDYFSSNYFDEDFTSKVLSKTGYAAEDIKEFNKKITPLKDRFYRFKQLFIEGKLRTKDKIEETHKFHSYLLNVLGYDGDHHQYKNLFHLTEKDVIPVRHILYRGVQPHLMIMEMQALIREDDTEPDGLFEQQYNVAEEELASPPQRYHRSQWDRVFTTPAGVTISPVIINKAISELFLLEQHNRPKYIMLLAGNVVFLLEQEKWFRGSYLEIDLEELFTEATANRNANYYALFYFLLGKETLAPDSNMVLLDQLDEDSHKSAYEVTKDLKEGIINAVEALANEAIWYHHNKVQIKENLDETDDTFEQEIKDDCLRFIYRLLFIFYAESREDLDILPSNDSIYNKGYSLEMLRDLEQVPLYSESSINGYFFHESLSKLFYVLSSGYRESENGNNKSFRVRHIDSPIFDDRKLYHLHKVKFRNKTWQDIICQLSLSKQQKNKTRGRISYANLGINQLGSVYESLLAFRGFYAEQDYIEVHKAGKPKEGTYMVPRSRRDDFKENEILKDSVDQDIITKKGAFVYRLSGRDRQKSASYYTPEVLTKSTVKYTLKPILEKLEKGEMKAIELLDLKLLEPAMGAAAFHNEMINQVADAYLTYRQKELRDSGRKEWRVAPDKYLEELQRVKAYIATNNTYGVDLNPTAIELGKLSLWLNVIHKDMETPFFSNRLAVGNAVVGAWLKVYAAKDVEEEYELIKDSKGKSKRVPVKKEWWNKAPRLLEFKPSTNYVKINHDRKADEIYHFLLPDKNMLASAGIKMLKVDYEAESKAVSKWKAEWCKQLTKSEVEILKKISNKIDELLIDYYKFQRSINQATATKQHIFGVPVQQLTAEMRSYDEKERLADQRNRHNAPYFKLKMVMDYWCSLWFWDVREAATIPNRRQYWQDIEEILKLNVNKAVEGMEDRRGQQNMFETGVQMSMVLEPGTSAAENQAFTDVVVDSTQQQDLFDKNQRLVLVSQLAKQYFFFHPQLEFLEVFWERGGFDLIAGNPPWVNIELDEAGVLSEKNPEISIRDYSAPQIKKKSESILDNDDWLKSLYINEFIWADSTKSFIGAEQNYPLLIGQRNNLYKCIVSNSLLLSNKNGFIGLVHPEGIFDDPRAGNLRKEIYYHLKYHFHFRNGLKLFAEVHDQMFFSINVYSGNKSAIGFFAISELLLPNTIDGCFISNDLSTPKGIKVKKNNSFEWNVSSNRNRLMFITEKEIRLINSLFEDRPVWNESVFVSTYSKQLIDVYEKLSFSRKRLGDVKYFSTDGLNETNAVKDEIIKRETKYLEDKDVDFVMSGPHFYLGNPFYKCPKKACKLRSDYDNIDHLEIPINYRPRTNYLPNNLSKIKEIGSGFNWYAKYRVIFGKMLNQPGERTLQSALITPNVSHVNSIISVVTEKESEVIILCALASSIVYDFYIKITGKNNLYDETLKTFPIAINNIYIDQIFNRTLQLNCLNKYYAPLWQDNWQDSFVQDQWSKNDTRLKPFDTLTQEWQWSTPLRNWFERRQALVEIDVITAMALDLTLEELSLIYNVQFPVLQQNEDDTWYDTKGNIVFTCSKGLTGVGLDRPVWDTIKELKAGQNYEHTIKSELYKGQKMTYYAPFDKCDRVADYKVAWEHFEELFKN